MADRNITHCWDDIRARESGFMALAHLHRDWAHPMPHLHRGGDGLASTTQAPRMQRRRRMPMFSVAAAVRQRPTGSSPQGEGVDGRAGAGQ